MGPCRALARPVPPIEPSSARWLPHQGRLCPPAPLGQPQALALPAPPPPALIPVALSAYALPINRDGSWAFLLTSPCAQVGQTTWTLELVEGCPQQSTFRVKGGKVPNYVFCPQRQ